MVPGANAALPRIPPPLLHGFLQTFAKPCQFHLQTLQEASNKLLGESRAITTAWFSAVSHVRPASIFRAGRDVSAQLIQHFGSKSHQDRAAACGCAL